MERVTLKLYSLWPKPTIEEIADFEKFNAVKRTLEFQKVFSWMFDLEEYTEVMRYKYEQNPFLAMVKPDASVK